MGAFAILDGIHLCKFREFREPDGLIADEARTASGAFRRDVTTLGRSWHMTLGHLTGDEFSVIQNHFLNHYGESLFWYGGFGGTYPQDARPVLVRAEYRHQPGPSITGQLGTKPYLLTEAGEHLTTEDGDLIVLDTIQPLTGRDYLGGEIRLVVTQVTAGAT